MSSFAIIASNQGCGENIKNALIQAGAIEQDVTLFISEVEVPNEQTLNKFDAIIVNSSSTCWKAPVTVGTAIANFSDQGGGVVVTLFSNCTDSEQFIGGRFKGELYHPLDYQKAWESKGEFNYSTCSCDSHHPILNGVNLIDGVAYVKATALPDATVIASFSNGYPLVAERVNKKSMASIVSINMYAVRNISKFNMYGYSPECDGHILCLNALKYAAEKSRRGRVKMPQQMLKQVQQKQFVNVVIVTAS